MGVGAGRAGNLLDSPLWVDSLCRQYAEKWGISEEEVRRKYVEQAPLKRGCTYEDVCNVVVFLASDEGAGEGEQGRGGDKETRVQGKGETRR